MLTDEIRYKLLQIMQLNPGVSQRDVARKLGISLGKASYCVKSLIERGLVKAPNFRESGN